MLNVHALPSALADSCASPLTKTYMEVGNPETETGLVANFRVARDSGIVTKMLDS